MKISVVSPVYMAGRMVRSLTDRLTSTLEAMQCQYEIILVNDCSPDDSWQQIRQCCAANHHIKGVSLSRNFGQHQAIAAGLGLASGNWIVVMDCDLQDRPEEIPNLMAKAMEGYDIVLASRANRQDSWAKKLSSRLYHWVLNKISGLGTNPTVANFGIYSRRVIEQYNMMPEVTKLFGAQIKYLGFSSSTIEVMHQPREEGKSSYSIGKLLRLASSAIIANTSRPLHWAAKMGLMMSAISFALAIYNIVAKICGIITLPGYTTTVFSIWFVGGLILMMLGVIGLYIGKIFDQAKGRQPYIIMETENFSEEEGK
ncbi:MAG: glycosyltransferase family 2 protein [Bacteroidales bacterium]|nr:glycosyltransferase family 2 protein [Bacteroidales bacterium]